MRTPSSNLSINDFQSIWLEDACDPPAFTAAKLKAKATRDEDKHANKTEEQMLIDYTQRLMSEGYQDSQLSADEILRDFGEALKKQEALYQQSKHFI